MLKHPNKDRAHKLVAKALKDGVLIKSAVCESCGSDCSTNRIVAHHNDYDKPYEVIWLCSACHSSGHNGVSRYKFAKTIARRRMYNQWLEEQQSLVYTPRYV